MRTSGTCFASALVLIALCQPAAAAEKSAVQAYDQVLRNALLCKTKKNPLTAIRALEAQGQDLTKAGIDFHKSGEDEEITITLKNPLTVLGAMTRVVHAKLSGTLFVYGEFTGDRWAVIKGLIGLTRNGPNDFVLGCGWCNGG